MNVMSLPVLLGVNIVVAVGSFLVGWVMAAGRLPFTRRRGQ